VSAHTETTPMEPIGPSEGRKPWVIVAAVAAAGLLGALVWFLVAAPLFGDADVAPAAAPPEVATTDAPGELVAGEALEAEPLVVTYDVLLERDPFEPVVPRPAAETAPATDAVLTAVDGVLLPPITDAPAPEGAVDDGRVREDGTSGSDPTPPEPEASEPTGCETSADGAVCDGRTITLVRVTERDGRRVAVVQVGTTIYEVEEGESFAASFRMQTVGTDRVTVLYADDVVELRVGERVLK
jgi:hypothetical protein